MLSTYSDLFMFTRSLFLVLQSLILAFTGSKERLLEQRIPASYLALEDVVGVLALERRVQGRDPVLPADKYQALVTQEMSARGHRPFRDSAELNQATTFLHENGISRLLLKLEMYYDLFFIDFPPSNLEIKNVLEKFS